MILTMGKTFTFDAAHHLPYHRGKCKNLHGHRYELTVEIFGEMQGLLPDGRENPEFGMIMDFERFTEIVKRIVHAYDHQNLNVFIANPTTEFLAHRIFAELVMRIPDIASITLRESEKTFVRLVNPEYMRKIFLDKQSPA